MIREFGGVANSRETISAIPGCSQGRESKIRWIETLGGAGKHLAEITEQSSRSQPVQVREFPQTKEATAKPGGSHSTNSLAHYRNAGLDLDEVELVTICAAHKRFNDVYPARRSNRQGKFS